LASVRDVARARGGDIVPEDSANGREAKPYEAWTVRHPSADVPDFSIRFFSDGVAGIYFVDHSGIDNGPDKSYERDRTTGLTHLERLAIAVINGGYREVVGYDEQGQEVRADSVIEGDDVIDIGGHGFTRTGARELEYRYPAWPR
jgi:hypothetical protein